MRVVCLYNDKRNGGLTMEFSVGQQVVCIDNRNRPDLTEGKTYTVI